MNNIKGRLIITHAGIALLMAPVLIYSYLSVQNISKARTVREKITLFNTYRLKASEHFALMLDYDMEIDSFYQGLETVNHKKYKTYLQKSRQTLELLKELDDFDNPVYRRRLEKSDLFMNQLNSGVREVIELRKTRGFRDFGFVGDMRDHIHRLEEPGYALSMEEILSLRRREKDFFLRHDPTYVRLLNQECEALLSRLKPDTTFLRTRQELLAYRVLFNEVVRIDESLGNINGGLIRDIYDSSQALENEYNALFEIVNSHSAYLIERVRLYITVFFVLTLLVAGLLAFYISNKISRPLSSTVENMERLRATQFDSGELPTVNSSIRELQILSSTYRELIEKIREQFGHLQTKNDQLNELNLQLKKSEKELKEASQVKDKFFSIISHDLRGHAGNISSLSQLLDSEGEELHPDQRILFVRHIRETSQNLLLLLENLLNWAKSQMNDHKLVKKSFDINEVISNNIHLFNETARQKGIDLQFAYRDIPNVYADKDMVDFAIRNLLSNSIKFSGSGDRIGIELMSIQESIQVKIRDTGIGMNSDQIDALENRRGESISRTGTGEEKGSGLGFSTTKDFIKRNGGHIKIYSEVGKGTSIVFTLPTSLTRESLVRPD